MGCAVSVRGVEEPLFPWADFGFRRAELPSGWADSRARVGESRVGERESCFVRSETLSGWVESGFDLPELRSGENHCGCGIAEARVVWEKCGYE